MSFLLEHLGYLSPTESETSFPSSVKKAYWCHFIFPKLMYSYVMLTLLNALVASITKKIASSTRLEGKIISSALTMKAAGY